MIKLFKKVSLFLPLLIILVWINYFIDPQHLLSNKFYSNAGEKLEYSNIIVPGNSHSHKLIKEVVLASKESSSLVLGSSRTLIVDTADFGDSAMLNLSLASATLDDILSAYALYESEFGTPEQLLIGIDPWIFNESNSSKKFKVLGKYYNNLAKKIRIEECEVNNGFYYSNLISLSYFQESLKSIYDFGWQEVMCTPIVNLDSLHSNKVRLSNGTVLYPTDFTTDTLLINKGAVAFFNQIEMQGFKDYHNLSKNKIASLEKFLAYLSISNIEVTLFMPPYHPLMWDYIKDNDNYKTIHEVDILVKQLAEKYDFPLMGSYNPRKYNLKSQDFYDAVHAQHSALEKIGF